MVKESPAKLLMFLYLSISLVWVIIIAETNLPPSTIWFVFKPAVCVFSYRDLNCVLNVTDDASPMADEGFTMQPNIYALNKALAALGEDNVLQDEEDLPHRYDPTHLGAIPEEVQGELSEDFVVPAIG